jgi:sortase A
MRRGLRTLSTVLIVAGALLLADAVTTLLWQEPLSALYGHIQQGKLEDKLAQIERAPLAAVDQRAIARLDQSRRLTFAARALARDSAAGDPLGKIAIPRIGLDAVFVQGTGTSDLRKGPGHYPATPLPGQHGTVAIAGHRTTYLAPFHDVNELRPGDRITLSMPYGRFEYRVERTRIVAPTALWVTDRVGYDRLILSACHPLYSAAQRIVVFAKLERADARGPASG